MRGLVSLPFFFFSSLTLCSLVSSQSGPLLLEIIPVPVLVHQHLFSRYFSPCTPPLHLS